MATAQEVITLASSYKNKNYQDMRKAGMRAGGGTNAWCADFVAFILEKLNIKKGLSSSSQQFIGMSGYHSKGTYLPKKGDVFILTNIGDSGHGHTGFVAEDAKGTVSSFTFKTVEGNSNSKVRIGSYSSSGTDSQRVTGFWTPPYNGKLSRDFNITKQDLGTYTVTGYCPCSVCCGKWANGITSTGAKAKADWTIAVDPKKIKYGSYIEMDGHVYHAEDCGGAIKDTHIDRYFSTHEQAKKWGKQSKKLLLLKGTDSELKAYAEYVNSGGLTSSGNTSSSKIELNSTKIVSTEGTEGKQRNLFSVTKNGDWYKGYELYIQNEKGNIFQPVVADGIQWSTSRTNTPGKLTFTVLKDDIISFNEGSAVQFKVFGDGVFYGYVFNKQRSSDDRIKVTAYDQLLYFRNKHTYCYTQKTASDVLQMIINDFKLTSGTIDDTGFIINKRIEDNVDLFNIMQTAIDLTWSNKGARYILYDDFGSLSLVNTNKLKYDVMISGDNIEDFDYSTTIENSANKIVMYKDNDSGCREMKIYQDGDSITRWGLLQHTQSYSKDENPDVLGRQLLSEKNRVVRKLSVKGVLGDIRIRAGAQILVKLNLGDILLDTNMMVEQAAHNFYNDKYMMDLSLIKNGEFTA